MNNKIALALAALVLTSCGPDSLAPGTPPEVGKSTVALIAPGFTPVPCLYNTATAKYEVQWHASQVDLLVADALTRCTRSPDGTGFNEGGTASDAYLNHVVTNMDEAVPRLSAPFPAGATGDDRSVFHRWFDYRGLSGYNCDPITVLPNQSVDLSTPVVGVHEVIAPAINDLTLKTIPRTALANGDLRTAGVNLCIAQQLRQIAPGVSGGETLLLSEADQRELLEIVRERAQIAMLHYALLGSVFALPFDGTKPDESTGTSFRIPDLQYWAYQCSLGNAGEAPGCTPDHLKKMGSDFATAVQLHIAVSQEIEEMFARSRSASEPFDVAPATPADAEWGQASWHQRTLAAMYGGDPLAVGTDGPWKHPLGQTGPVDNFARFPSYQSLPYVQQDLSDPRVRSLESLARRFDVMRLVVSSSATTTDGCQGIDLDASRDELYKWVEANLREATCAHPLSTGCTSASTEKTSLDGAAVSSVALDNFSLWNRYRIQPSHAEALVHFWAQVADPSQAMPSRVGCSGTGPMPFRLGALDIDGSVSIVSDSQSPTGKYLKFDKNTSFAQVPMEDQAPVFTRLVPFNLPGAASITDDGSFALPEVIPGLASSRQGFSPDSCYPSCPGAATESKRQLGAISALTAVRHNLIRNMEYLSLAPASAKSGGRLNDYFANAKDMIGAINGAIGDRSTVVRPIVDFFTLDVAASSGGSDRSMWQVEVTYDDDDDFFKNPSGALFVGCSIGSTDLFSDASQIASNLALHPAANIFGKTLDSLTSVANSKGECAFVDLNAPTDAYGGRPRRAGIALAIPNGISNGSGKPDGESRTLLLLRGDASGTRVRLLGGRMQFLSPTSTSGQYLAADGALGNFLRQQVTPRDGNPARHEFDGFGLQTDWVPPLNAELLGGTAGEPTHEFFIAKAKQAALDASTAVDKAVDGLLTQARDEQQFQASLARSQESMQQAQDELCGQGNPECAIKTVEVSPQADWYDVAVPDPGGGCSTQSFADLTSGGDGKFAVKCMVFKVFQQLLAVKVKVAQPVLDQIHQPTAPAFDRYSGGKLQSAFIEQWRALKAPGPFFQSAVAAMGSVLSRIDAADNALSRASDKEDRECGILGGIRGFLSGFSFGTGGLNFSLSAANQQFEACKAAKDELGAAQDQATVSQSDALSTLASAIAGALDAQAAIQQSAATVAQDTTSADLAIGQAKLEQTLASSGLTSSFGLARRVRDADAWRAKALVENARRVALAARRSVEAQYVVNLSELSADEAFVASPAGWADGIYRYDLSLPSAVGLVVAPSNAGSGTQTGAIYANAVTDYVTNLENFVAGYATSRPTATAKDDIDVVDLGGFTSTHDVGANGAAELVEGGKWSLECGSAGWTPLGPGGRADATCCSNGTCSQPTRARLDFCLDPWGRLDRSGISVDVFDRRFNARWGALAVNLVGTGVKDCTKADDKNACYAQGFVQYDMSHAGPAWITDFEQLWRTLGVPVGRIEGGKALAAEVVLDPLRDGWNTSYIAPVKRTEFEMRPLGGAYELELEVTPELVLDNIERVQLLLGTNYWVKQN